MEWCVETFCAELRSEDRADSRQMPEATALHHQVTQAFEDARDDVFRYLITLGLYPPQAQDATQEVFLRLYVEMKKGEQIRNVRAWVFRVAHNLGLQMRAKEDTLRPFDPGIEESLRDTSQTPEFGLIERERMLRLHSAMEALSPQQRQCLQLRAQGLRYHEIAETIGIGVSTVSEFLRRAIQRLRKATHE
jgi:RNA polymerase sigma-70 factor, ECF subfamily